MSKAGIGMTPCPDPMRPFDPYLDGASTQRAVRYLDDRIKGIVRSLDEIRDRLERIEKKLDQTTTG